MVIKYFAPGIWLDFSVLLTDIDECLNNPCHSNASCTDSEGSFDCQCNNGYAGDGVSNCASRTKFHTWGFVFVFRINVYVNIFIDINECITNPCHHNASCTDNEGSFVCQCNSGFSGDGLNCTSKANSHALEFRILT
jgi:hypothetical protein